MQSTLLIRQEGSPNGFLPIAEDHSSADDARAKPGANRPRLHPAGQEMGHKPELEDTEMAAAVQDESSDECLDLEPHEVVKDAGHQPAYGSANGNVAALRKVLDDIRAEDASAADVEAEEPTAPEPAPAGVSKCSEHRGTSTSLFRQTDPLTGLEAADTPEGEQVVLTIADLRRTHMKRAKRQIEAKARRNKGGSLLTVTALLGTVAAIMVGLYVMQPQIAEAQPQFAPALTEYVETVDKYAALGAEWKSWVTERIGGLSSSK